MSSQYQPWLHFFPTTFDTSNSLSRHPDGFWKSFPITFEKLWNLKKCFKTSSSTIWQKICNQKFPPWENLYRHDAQHRFSNNLMISPNIFYHRDEGLFLKNFLKYIFSSNRKHHSLWISLKATSGKMTKRFEFNWQIEVPEPLRTGCIFDRWTEEKDNTEIELNCMFKVDEYGFFIYWQSEGRVRIELSLNVLL